MAGLSAGDETSCWYDTDTPKQKRTGQCLYNSYIVKREGIVPSEDTGG